MNVARPIIALCLVTMLSSAWAQDPTVKQQCAKDWPTDYRMQKYCINKQVESINRLKRAWDELKKGTEEYNIMMRCYKQWPTSVGGLPVLKSSHQSFPYSLVRTILAKIQAGISISST